MQNNQTRQNWRRENLFVREIAKFMNAKSEYLLNLIFEKLKKHKSRKINLEKDEFKEFVFYLINNS